MTVRRGSGVLTANLSASFYQVRLNKLPESVTLFVTVASSSADPSLNTLSVASDTRARFITLSSYPAVA